MNSHALLMHIGIALLAALVGGAAARLLRLPILIGYLVAGIAIGPYTPGIFADPQALQLVAHVGVALLMFAVGVHFSLDELRSVQRVALLGGGLQIVGTTILGVLLGMALGWGVYGGLFLGCALSLSSTAVMMKVLEERGEQGTGHGSVMLSILVVQDFSLVAMIAILPALASVSSNGAGALLSVLFAALRAALFIGITALLATRAVPALMHRVAKSGSKELFLLLVVCLCLLAAKAAEAAGLGLELGAFIAGIVISETDFAHEVFSQIRPLRDVFASLFFVSIGMLLNPQFVLHNWVAVGSVVLAIVLGKSLISMLAVYALGWHGRTAILVGAGLAQIGEFSFVLATIGSSQKLIPAAIGNTILSAALITLLLAPFVYQSAVPLYNCLSRVPALARRLNRQTEAAPEPEECPTAIHVLVLGYGRVGRYVSDALNAKGIGHIVADYDAEAIKRLKAAGVRTVYGDASSETVLAQTQPTCLQLAVVALPDADVTEMAVRTLKRMAPKLAIVARVHRGMDILRMRAAGAEGVVHAEFEAGTEMIRQSLERLGVTGTEAGAYIEEVRQNRYRA